MAEDEKLDEKLEGDFATGERTKPASGEGDFATGEEAPHDETPGDFAAGQEDRPHGGDVPGTFATEEK
jgi:hypothetical protein